MKKLEIPIRYVCECSNSLLPMEGIVRQSKNFSWKSNIPLPLFKISKRPVFSGWYMIEVKVTADREYLDAAFTFYHSNKCMKKNNNHPILLINKKTIKRVVYIASSVENISFSPSEQKVSLTINSLRFVKITQRLALKLMRKKLITYYPDSSFDSHLQLWRHYSNFFKNQKKSEIDFPDWVEKREPSFVKKELHVHQKTEITIIIDISANSTIENHRDTLNSLGKQIYTNWEAIVIIDSKSNYATIEKLLNYNKKTIINFIQKKEKQQVFISDILAKSDSTYYLLLPNNVILPEYALSVYSRNIYEDKKALIIYADNDIINEKKERSKPNFKPNWNPDFLLSQNYIGECLVINSSLLKKEQHQEIDINGSWIYSILIQQVTRKIKIKHISLILNHIIQTENGNLEEKHQAQLLSLQNHLSKTHATASHGKVEGTFRINWPIQDVQPLVSIIIPTRDGLEILQRAIDSILTKTSYSNYEIIIVDNQSQKPETIQYLTNIQSHEKLTVLKYNKAFNFSSLNNYAVTKAKGTVLALLNNDVEVISPHWLTEMVSQCERPEIGCVGAMLYYPDNRIQHAGVIIGLGGCAGHSHKFYNLGDTGYNNRLVCVQNYSAVTAACLIVRKAIFNEVGGLNEKDLAVAFNDVDFCLKVQALGYRNIWSPWAELYHHESVSRGQDNTSKKRRRLTSEVKYMKDTWKTAHVTDPNYSKFLTRIREDFSLGL